MAGSLNSTQRSNIMNYFGTNNVRIQQKQPYLFAHVPIHKVKKSDCTPPACADKLKKNLENVKKTLMMVTISHFFNVKC